MIDTILSAILQVLVFSLIPFLVYWISKRKIKGFLEYIGLKRSTRKANLLALLIVIILAGPMLLLAFFNDEFKEILTHKETITGMIREMGLGGPAIVTIIFTALLKTALAEEIFFRGFIAKRLIAVTNFQIGNVIQAILFGAIHLLLFLTITQNPLFLTVIFVFPAVGAYLKTFILKQRSLISKL